jgi:hypothetical protein
MRNSEEVRAGNELKLVASGSASVVAENCINFGLNQGEACLMAGMGVKRRGKPFCFDKGEWF